MRYSTPNNGAAENIGGAVLYFVVLPNRENGVNKMRTEAEISRYQKTLARYRDGAKAQIASTQSGSEAYTEAIKVFLRCDGAIEILNWVMEIETRLDFSLPTVAQRHKG
jgi:hypothetical protein